MSNSTEMVELVARALIGYMETFANSRVALPDEGDWAAYSPLEQAKAIAAARAAIEAMPVPALSPEDEGRERK